MRSLSMISNTLYYARIVCNQGQGKTNALFYISMLLACNQSEKMRACRNHQTLLREPPLLKKLIPPQRPRFAKAANVCAARQRQMQKTETAGIIRNGVKSKKSIIGFVRLHVTEVQSRFVDFKTHISPRARARAPRRFCSADRWQQQSKSIKIEEKTENTN